MVDDEPEIAVPPRVVALMNPMLPSARKVEPTIPFARTEVPVAMAVIPEVGASSTLRAEPIDPFDAVNRLFSMALPPLTDSA